MNLFIPGEAQRQFKERLREVEQQRLAYQFLASRPRLLARLGSQLGDRLIALGQQLKAAAQPAPQYD